MTIENKNKIIEAIKTINTHTTEMLFDDIFRKFNDDAELCNEIAVIYMYCVKNNLINLYVHNVKRILLKLLSNDARL